MAAYGIGKYMEILLQSEFPQFNLMTAGSFSGFLKSLGLEFSEKSLEYYDKKNIIRPALRLNLPLSSNKVRKYSTLMLDTYSIKEYYKGGIVEFPKEGDFQPWKNYKNGYEENTLLFYHPYQFIQFKKLMNTGFVFSSQFIEETTDIQNICEKLRERAIQSTETNKRSNEEFWIPRVGLLMVLESAYGPPVKGFITNIWDKDNFIQKYSKWRNNNFSASELRIQLGFDIEKINNFYKILAGDAHHLDPMSNWYVFIELVKESRKANLKKDALIAQKYYKLAKMVKWFLNDLGEQVPDPDEVYDLSHGSWKKDIFGDPFDYDTKKTQDAIKNVYLDSIEYKLALVYEGKTEDLVIREFLQAWNVDITKDGILLYDAEGVGNMSRKNLDGLITSTKKMGLDLLVILDNDSDSKEIMYSHIKKGEVALENFHIWNNDFEYDNFGIDAVLSIVNSALEKRAINLSQNFIELTKEMTENEISTKNVVLMRAIDNLLDDRYGGLKLENVINKKNMAKSLIESRIQEIKNGQHSRSDVLPIEQVLNSVVNKIPRWG